MIDSLLRNDFRRSQLLKKFKQHVKVLHLKSSLDTLEKDFRNRQLPDPDGYDFAIAYYRLSRGTIKPIQILY